MRIRQAVDEKPATAGVTQLRYILETEPLGRLNVLNSLLLAKVRLNIEYTRDDRIKLSWRVPSNLDDRVSYHVERSLDTVEWERVPNLDIAIKEAEGEFMAEAFVRFVPSIEASSLFRVTVDLHIEGS